MKISDQLFDSTVNGLGSALNFRLLKQNVHASNVANANTPGYKAQKLDFEQALHDAIDPHESNALQATRSEHFSNSAVPPDEDSPDIYENPDGVINESGNSVNMEREMAELAQNRILYNATVSMVKKKFGMMKYAIQDSER